MATMVNTCYIPFLPCNLNDYIRAERANRYIAAKLKADYCKEARPYVSKLRLSKCYAYDVVCEWITPTKRADSDNIFFGIKFILDAIVNAGCLDTDGYSRIRNISHKRAIKKGKAGVKITFIMNTEAED